MDAINQQAASLYAKQPQLASKCYRHIIYINIFIKDLMVFITHYTTNQFN